MTLPVLFAILLATGSGAGPEVCAGTVRATEPQYRIRESDLDHAAAVRAADSLRDMVARGNVEGEYQFGALNQLKILTGHVLLTQALSDRNAFGVDSVEARESTASFCTWLARDGFWYD